MLFQDGGPSKKAKNIKESDAGQSHSVIQLPLSLSLSQHLIVLMTIKMQEEFAYQNSKQS